MTHLQNSFHDQMDDLKVKMKRVTAENEILKSKLEQNSLQVSNRDSGYNNALDEISLLKVKLAQSES